MTVPYQTRPTSELAHLAWCLLTSVRLAQKEGKAHSSLEQHVFVMQWLLTAQKRKLFPKSVAPDIIWLLAQGKKYGFGANLLKKVEYIYRSSAEELAAQSDLFRFAYFVETLKTMGWLDLWSHVKSGISIGRALILPAQSIHPKRIYSPLLMRMENLSKHSRYDSLGISPVFSPY